MSKGHKRLIKFTQRLTLGLLCPVLMLVIGFLVLDRSYPLDLSRYQTLSTEILDDQDQPLRLYLSADGYLRLPVRPDQVDPNYIRMLIAYEDKRFYQHYGVDPLALIRAAGQAISNGRIVSGASTLTMQVAKLLEPRPRTLGSKLIDIFRALQLEQRFSKDDILSIYLTLAPFGGNREGIRAAALTYFNRSPATMTAGEAALFVALPQSPSLNRPDRHPLRAQQARDKILQRIRHSGAFAPDVIDLALKEEVSATTRPLPLLAPHLSDRLKAQNKEHQTQKTWIRADLQRWTERTLRHYVKTLPVGTSAAVLIVENKGRRTISYVGSAHYSDPQSAGYVDMVRAVRSPGSTLKPMIYGMALDRGLAHPESLINDVPTAFGNYQPKNFRDQHYGDISLKDALRKSLNVPAVIALERVGPTQFVAGMRRHGLELILPGDAAKPGLAVALGGVGTRLESLVSTYAALAGDGRIYPLEYVRNISAERQEKSPFLNEKSLWYLADILRGVQAPAGMVTESSRPKRRDISYKTGTSYGFRDAWAIGYNQDYTVGIWIGRPDGAPNPGLFGASAAAPFLFQVFDRLPDAPAAHLKKPAHLLQAAHGDLPPGLKRLDRAHSRTQWVHNSPPPQITFPLPGSLILLPEAGQKLILKAEGGKRPLTWVVNGYPLPARRWARELQWQPDGPGFTEITLIDALGRRVTSDIQIQ